MKKCILVLLLIVTMISSTVVVMAEETADTISMSTVISKTESILKQIEPNKELYGLKNVDLSSLYLGAEIPLYESKSSGLKELSFKCFPIQSEEGTTVAFILAYLDASGQTQVNFTTEFVDEMNSLSGSPSIVYDSRNTVLVDKFGATVVFTNEALSNSKRVSIDLETISSRVSNKRGLSEATDLIELDINSLNTRGGTTSRLLQVPRYRQQDNSDYCWACCLVSVGKYFFPNTNINPVDVAIGYKGDLQTGTSSVDTLNIMNIEFPLVANGLIYACYLNDLTFVMVTNDINANEPIIARAATTFGSYGHFVVVCGYQTDSTGNYYTIMDSLSGTYRVGSVDSNNKPVYVSLSGGEQKLFQDSIRIF